MNIPATVNRVPRNTSDSVNEQLREEMEQNIARYGMAGDEAIGERLQELDEEWDIERALEANAAMAALLGLGLGALVNRKFFALPAVVAGFLLQHALQGWCPPVPVFRRLGFRTQPEIARERYALKALRGDFVGIDSKDVPQAIQAVRR
jgi:hypothetical protein